MLAWPWRHYFQLFVFEKEQGVARLRSDISKAVLSRSLGNQPGFTDHLINLFVAKLLTKIGHDVAKLSGGDETISVLVENLEGILRAIMVSYSGKSMLPLPSTSIWESERDISCDRLGFKGRMPVFPANDLSLGSCPSIRLQWGFVRGSAWQLPIPLL
jgi:hypothetical protein